jgi:tetratricopeptide (TPR) repeat protein
MRLFNSKLSRQLTIGYLSFTVLLTSCGVTQYVAVPVDYAPKLRFYPDSVHVLIVSRLVFDSTKTSKRHLKFVKGAAFAAIKGMQEQLHLLPGVKVTSLVDSVTFRSITDSAKQLAMRYKSNYVLTFNSFDYKVVLDQFQYENNVPIAYYNLRTSVGFTLYESNGVYFKKLKGSAEEPADNSGDESALPVTAREAELDAIKDYLPFTITNNRPLYDQGVPLAQSITQIQKGRFDLAFKILNPLIDGTDKKLAGMAAYNLAVVYEAQGDIEEALELAKISNEKWQNDYAKTLRTALMKE